jgi:hypothetical protein
MFRHSQDRHTPEERARLNRTKCRPVLNRIFDKTDGRSGKEAMFVDAYEIVVEKCFILSDFNEELPLYLLDLGGLILVLFGQWMFDSYTLVTPEGIFQEWDCQRNFFRSFSLRCSPEHGIVFRLSVGGTELVEAHQLPFMVRFKQLRECQFFARHWEAFIQDLDKAGMIEPRAGK